MPATTFQKFIEAINEHSVQKIKALLHNQHQFTDANNTIFSGIETVAAGWQMYFKRFPDYRLEIKETFADANKIFATGFASATFNGQKKENKLATFNLPIALKCETESNKIKLWQVFADTKIPSEIISRFSGNEINEEKILAFGGVFFKAKDPATLCAWYDKHLGTQFGKNTWSTFKWRERNDKEKIGRTEFSVFKNDTDYFNPSTSSFMFNFRVNNIEKLIARLKQEGVTVDNKIETFDYGKFAWIYDLEGNKIELWQPVDEVLEEYDKK